MSVARLQILGELRVGTTVRLRLIIQHAMETGYLQSLSGKTLARNIIKKITCQADNFEIFRVDPSSGIAANPYFEFNWKVFEAKAIKTSWVDDLGVEGELLTKITTSQSLG